MSDFQKELQGARSEIRDPEACDLDRVAVHLDAMEEAYDELIDEHDDFAKYVRIDRVQCAMPDATGWHEVTPGNAEYGEDPERWYCTYCTSEVVRVGESRPRPWQCTWKPEEST